MCACVCVCVCVCFQSNHYCHISAMFHFLCFLRRWVQKDWVQYSLTKTCSALFVLPNIIKQNNIQTFQVILVFVKYRETLHIPDYLNSDNIPKKGRRKYLGGEGHLDITM